jgi:hypothetical protein
MHISNHPSKPLIWWYNRRAMIDMQPSYQRRGRLWSPFDKAYLIDSIINGFDVPKLYFADFQLGESKLNNNKLPYAIIDGKQRLEAIFDFFDGKIVLNSDFVWKKDRSAKIGGLSLKDLKKGRYAEVAEIFETETVDIMSVVTDNEAEINELFVRLNRSKPLTGAEVRNAMVGPVPDIVRNIARHPFFDENIRFSAKRAGDLNAAAKLLMFEYFGRITSTKKSDLDSFALGRDMNLDRLHLAGYFVNSILSRMQIIFLPKDSLLSSAGVLPVYYWLTRENDAALDSIIRAFLVDFQAGRDNLLTQGLQQDLERNNKYIRFDILNRSVNDLSSHIGRFDILNEGLRRFAQAQ